MCCVFCVVFGRKLLCQSALLKLELLNNLLDTELAVDQLLKNLTESEVEQLNYLLDKVRE